MENVNDKILKQNIDRLDISCEILELLKEEKIITIEQLCSKTKTNLKELGLKQEQIKDIEKGLQLEGFNLKNNY